MTFIFVCIDFDRDAAFPIKGRKYAVSDFILKEGNTINSPEEGMKLTGTVKSFKEVVSWLRDNKIPTIFFFEAHTALDFFNKYPEYIKLIKLPYFEFGSHAYDHEDLSGEETSVKLDYSEEKKLLEKSKKDLEKLFNKTIYGFRAPYMRLSPNTLSILEELKFKYDSSLYQESFSAISPFFITKNIIEFPVIKTPKKSVFGGMYTYLWPLFEKKRKKQGVMNNFINLVTSSLLEETYVSINLHSWHFYYSVGERRYLTESEFKDNLAAFIDLIKKLLEIETVVFSTPYKWLKEQGYA